MPAYKTVGTCAKEIHFEVKNGCLQRVEFVGGCAGNAQGLARVLAGWPLERVIEVTENIPCRNNTSCPDQLAKALKLYLTGELPELPAMPVFRIPYPFQRVAVFSDVHANRPALKAVLADVAAQGVDALFCLGDILGGGDMPNETLELLKESQSALVLSDYDQNVALNLEVWGDDTTGATGEARDMFRWTRRHTTVENKRFMAGLPIVAEFYVGQLRAVAFHGSPPDNLLDFRKEETYGREIETIVVDTDHLRGEGAEAILSQAETLFSADVYLFGYTHRVHYVEQGGKHFVNVGAVDGGNSQVEWAGYAIIAANGRDLQVEFREVRCTPTGRTE